MGVTPTGYIAQLIGTQGECDVLVWENWEVLPFTGVDVNAALSPRLLARKTSGVATSHML